MQQLSAISPVNEMILKDFTNLMGIRSSNNKVDIYNISNDEARPLNLLEEFQKIKVKPSDEEEQSYNKSN